MNTTEAVKEKLRADSPLSSKNASPFPESRSAVASAMSRLPSRMKILLLAAFAAGSLSAAWAQDPGRGGRGAERERGAEQAPRQRDSLSDSVRRFERSNRGSRVLSAERIQSDGRDVARIKAMDDRGRVRVYVDDPRSPRQLRGERPPTRGDHD
jgi:hypothetical protein